MANYLDLAGLTVYDTKLKEWVKSGLVDITDDEIRALFPVVQTNKEIWYTTSDKSSIYVNDGYCNADLVSNTYEQYGILLFDDKLTRLDGSCGFPGADAEGAGFGLFGSTYEESISVKTISIPGTIQYIRGNAFSGLIVVDKFNFNGTLKDWCNIEFDNSRFWENYEEGNYEPASIHPSQHISEGGIFTINDKELVDLIIPEDVTNIKDYVFYGLKSIKTLDLGNVQTIGNSAFEECTGLTSITIPSTVTSISSNAFKGAYIQSSNFTNNSSLDAEANNYWGAVIYDNITEDGLIIRGTEIIGYNGGSGTEDNPKYIEIPKTTTHIAPKAIVSVSNIYITYDGTEEEWRSIEKGGDRDTSDYWCLSSYSPGLYDELIIKLKDKDISIYTTPV